MALKKQLQTVINTINKKSSFYDFKIKSDTSILIKDTLLQKTNLIYFKKDDIKGTYLKIYKDDHCFMFETGNGMADFILNNGI